MTDHGTKNGIFTYIDPIKSNGKYRYRSSHGYPSWEGFPFDFGLRPPLGLAPCWPCCVEPRMMRWQAIPKVTGGKWRATWEHLGVRAIFKKSSPRSRVAFSPRWWQTQRFLIFITIWRNEPIWLIFFRWIETTNQEGYIYIYTHIFIGYFYDTWCQRPGMCFFIS